MAPASAPAPATPAAAAAAPSTASKGGKVLTTPAVRRMAREHDLDLAAVRDWGSTGKEGRVLKEDVIHYMEARDNGTLQQPSSSDAASDGPSSGGGSAAPPRVGVHPSLEGGVGVPGDRTEAVSGMVKIMIKDIMMQIVAIALIT